MRFGLGLGFTPNRQTAAAAVDPSDALDAYTSLNLNMNFKAANVTMSGAELVAVANLGAVDCSLREGAGNDNPAISGNDAVCAATDKMRTRNAADSADVNVSSLMSVSAGWILVVAAPDSDGISTDSADASANDGLVGMGGGDLFGLTMRSTGTVYAWNFDGSVDQVTLATGVTWDGSFHVFVWKHTGGQVGGSFDGVAATPGTSGNTSSLADKLQLNRGTAMKVRRLMVHNSVPADEAAIIALALEEAAA